MWSDPCNKSRDALGDNPSATSDDIWIKSEVIENPYELLALEKYSRMSDLSRSISSVDRDCGWNCSITITERVMIVLDRTHLGSNRW